MRRRSLFAGTVVLAAGIAALATGSGGPPPPDPPAPAAGTIVVHGSAQHAVHAQRPLTNASIERAARAARRAAFPRAIADARETADALAAASGLHAGDVVGVAQDANPLGWYDQNTGRFGPGRWCGTLSWFSYSTRADGTRRRVLHRRKGCRPPKDQDVRVTVTFAAS